MNNKGYGVYSILNILGNSALHRQILRLAIPMVLSNITVPLLGLVDAAVIGHLDHAWFLGGVALGSTMISVSFWLLGFLRMSTTGLTAQAFGKQNHNQMALVLLQGISMSIFFAVLFLLLHHVIADVVLGWSDASEQVRQYAADYFSIRSWGAPAALTNFVLLGWLLGTQNSKWPMWMVIVTNVTNILLDLLFVVVFDMKVSGAALASLISDYTGMFFAMICIYRYWIQQRLPSLLNIKSDVVKGLGRFLKLNREIFLRSLCLQAVFSFMTFRGATYGDDVVAANAVLMSFLMIISYGMDGFAYAIEALVGKAIGQNSRDNLKQALCGTTVWCVVISLGLTVFFAGFGQELIALLTDIDRVRLVANQYRYYLVCMPLIAMWCFLLDGVFIGATKGKEMRNGMVIALLLFFVTFGIFSFWQNHGLWLAMLVFMAVRGVTLGVIFYRQSKNKMFFVME